MAWVTGCHAIWACSAVHALTMFERGLWWLGWHEAEHVLQQRMDDGMQAAVLECVEVILGLLYIDIAQPGLGAVSQVRDHARGICGPRPSLMRAYISAVIGTW